MKKILGILLVLVMVLGLCACGTTTTTTTTTPAPTEEAVVETTETTTEETTEETTEATTEETAEEATTEETTEAATEETAEEATEVTAEAATEETAEATTEETAEVATEETTEVKTYTVGILQFMQHVALDQASQGFMDAIEAALPGQVTFDYKNASGETVNCNSIANDFVSGSYDLIMANATPALVACSNATAEIPVLGTAVTAYGVALEIEDFTGTVGNNVSGTSDLPDLSAQAAMILEWLPETKTVGLLFCSAEANSRYQIEEVKAYLEANGVTCTEYAFTDSNDLASVTETACANSDVIYIPTDNTAATYMETIANVCKPANQAVFTGEEGMCATYGIATLSISYYDLGVTTGEMAVKILTGEADVTTMAIGYTNATPKYNAAVCEQLGLTAPEGYVAIETSAE